MKPFHLPKLMKQHKHFLLLTATVSVDVVDEFGRDWCSVPRIPGLYGFLTAEERDKARRKLNSVDSEMKEVAFNVAIQEM